MKMIQTEALKTCPCPANNGPRNFAFTTWLHCTNKKNCLTCHSQIKLGHIQQNHELNNNTVDHFFKYAILYICSPFSNADDYLTPCGQI